MKTLRNRPSGGAARERGVVLLFCLIILVILLAGGVAIVRSMNTSLFGAGNLAFKRDLLNEGELGVSQAMLAFKAGGALATTAATAANLPSANYSAVELVTNVRGIPVVLLTKASGASQADIAGGTFTPTGADLSGRPAPGGGPSDIKVRYVIDRMCRSTGAFSSETMGKGMCVSAPTAAFGGSRPGGTPPPPSPPIYRLTVRVDGPRDTQAFLQTSFSKPE